MSGNVWDRLANVEQLDMTCEDGNAIANAVARGRELEAMEKRLRNRAAYILARAADDDEYGQGVIASWGDVLNTLDLPPDPFTPPSIRPGDTNAEVSP